MYSRLVMMGLEGSFYIIAALPFLVCWAVRFFRKEERPPEKTPPPRLLPLRAMGKLYVRPASCRGAVTAIHHLRKCVLAFLRCCCFACKGLVGNGNKCQRALAQPAGAISDKLELRDIVAGLGSNTNSNFAAQYGLPGTLAPTADYS